MSSAEQKFLGKFNEFFVTARLSVDIFFALYYNSGYG